MALVEVTPGALEQINGLPLPMQLRVRDVISRLANWPHTSGAKPLRGNLKGNFRIRTGDYRILLYYEKPADTVVVWRIGYRDGVYD